MTSRIDDLEELARSGDAWEASLRLHLAEYNDPIVAHATSMVTMAIAGIRKAIAKAGAAEERAASKAAAKQHDVDIRQYDKLTIDLAAAREIPPAEMQAIRDAAAARSRAAARRGSLADQTAAAPILGGASDD